MKRFVFIVIVLLLVSYVSGLQQVREGWKSESPSVQIASYSGQPYNCNTFRTGFTGANTTFETTQVGFHLKRASGSVGDFKASIWSMSGGVPSVKLAEGTYNDPGDTPLTSSLEWYNLTIPNVTIVQGVEYAVCIYNTQGTNYLHLYLNSSGGYAGGGNVYYTTSWKNDYYSTRDMDFRIYENFVAPVPTIVINGSNSNRTVSTDSTSFVFNGSVTNSNDTTANCYLYLNSILNQSWLMNNMSISREVTVEFGYLDSERYVYMLCSHQGYNATTNIFKWTIDNGPYILIDLINNQSTGDFEIQLVEVFDMLSTIVLWFGFTALTLWFFFVRSNKVLGLFLGFCGFALDFILISEMQSVYVVTESGLLSLGTVLFYSLLPITRLFLILYGLIRR